MSTTGASNPPPDQPPAKEPEAAKEPNLTSIGILIASLVSALGLLTVTGTVGRVQREDPDAFSAALGFLIFAGAFWIAAATFTAPKKATESRSRMDNALRGLAIVFALSGFIFGLTLAVHTVDNEPRPQITPNLSEDASKLTTEIKASGLPTDRRLTFRIDLLRGRQPIRPIYESFMGPDGDGNINQTVTVPLPKAGYEELGVMAYTGEAEPNCDDLGQKENEGEQENKKEQRERERLWSGTGCAIIALPDPKVE